MQVVQKLRLKYPLSILLEIAQMSRATSITTMDKADKYKAAKAEIASIYHENKGRYDYRRIIIALHDRKFALNHKTVQQLMK